MSLSRTKKKSSKKSKNEDLGKPYISHSIAKSPAVNGNMQNGHSSSFNKPASTVTANPIPRIPRATGGWDSKTNLEMAPSSSRQNLISSGRNTVRACFGSGLKLIRQACASNII